MRAELRRAWRCDCDGASHEALPVAGTSYEWAHRMAGAMEDLVGHRPQGCPWRAFYSPLVSAAIRIASDAEDGLATANLGDDPPALLLDAARLYVNARNVTRADEDRREHEKRMREMKQRK